jgi:hypothetical protein
MHIPSEVIDSAVTSYKTNLKRLYKIEQRGEEYKVYYNELYKQILIQEKGLKFFGEESIERWRNEARLEFDNNTPNSYGGGFQNSGESETDGFSGFRG